MEDENLPSLSELQRSLNSVRQLQRTGLGAILLMIIGIAVVVGSGIYSFTRLQPLEHQIVQKKTELDQIERAGQIASDRNQQIRRANEAAEKNLQRISAETHAALAKLETTSRKLPPGPARTSIESAAHEVRAAADAIKKAASDLNIHTEESHATLETLIQNLFDDHASVRLNAYDELLSFYRDDPKLVPGLISFARDHAYSQDGVYNTLVVLGQLDRQQIETHLSKIQKFVTDAASTGGPKTQKLAIDLFLKLGFVVLTVAADIRDPAANQAVHFTVTANLPAVLQQITFMFEWDDGSPTTVTDQPKATHVYSRPGRYRVRVIARLRAPAAKMPQIVINELEINVGALPRAHAGAPRTADAYSADSMS